MSAALAGVRLVLAPLAGFTDAPFRRLCTEGGADLTYTEMVSAAGLAHGSSPTRHLMETMEGEGSVGCQIFGAKEDDIARATAEVSNFRGRDGRRFAEINLNAGCPMTKVTRCGAGAKLVESPGRIFLLLKAMRENTDLPITLKTRLGPHPQRTTIFEILAAAEAAGASGLTVHARYTSEMHGGATHLDVLAEVVSRAKIPVTGNGSVVDRASAAKMAATGVAGLMIGRAALSAPDFFARLRGRPGMGNLVTRHLDYILQFRDELAEKYPNDHVPSTDGFAGVKMRTHLFRYFSGRPGAAALRAKINSVRTLTEIYDIIQTYGNGRDS